MKVILEFETEEPEEKASCIRALKADHAYMAHWDIENYLHDIINSESISDNEYNLYKKIAKDISEILDKWNIDFNDCPP